MVFWVVIVLLIKKVTKCNSQVDKFLSGSTVFSCNGVLLWNACYWGNPAWCETIQSLWGKLAQEQNCFNHWWPRFYIFHWRTNLAKKQVILGQSESVFYFIPVYSSLWASTLLIPTVIPVWHYVGMSLCCQTLPPPIGISYNADLKGCWMIICH